VGVVRFAAYRQYDDARIESSNAMMGLLAGAQLASHLLQLTEGSERLLPEVYPKVPHIGRFNLTSERARAILDEADTHLGSMGVPYALATHEDYMKTCLALLVRATLVSKTKADVNSASQHSTFEEYAGTLFNPDTLAQLNTLRLMRDCTIHSGGRASNALIDDLKTWSAATEAGWVKLAKRSPRKLQLGQRVTFTQAEMILALAITKNLDREANQALVTALPRTLWAELLVEDLVQDHPSALRAPDGFRRARGLARHYYSTLQLTDPEIKAAMFATK